MEDTHTQAVRQSLKHMKSKMPMTIAEHREAGKRLAMVDRLFSWIATGVDFSEPRVRMAVHRRNKSTPQEKALGKAHDALLSLRLALENEAAALLIQEKRDVSAGHEAVGIYFPQDLPPLGLDTDGHNKG